MLYSCICTSTLVCSGFLSPAITNTWETNIDIIGAVYVEFKPVRLKMLLDPMHFYLFAMQLRFYQAHSDGYLRVPWAIPFRCGSSLPRAASSLCSTSPSASSPCYPRSSSSSPIHAMRRPPGAPRCDVRVSQSYSAEPFETFDVIYREPHPSPPLCALQA